MKTIICGFAGIGKSTLAKNRAGVVDLESTPFNKNWDLYVDVALHMQKNGYEVLLSCHKELRDKLKERNADYVVVIPDYTDKNVYLQRFRDRGNTEAFIKMFEENWELFLKQIIAEEKRYWILAGNSNLSKL